MAATMVRVKMAGARRGPKRKQEQEEREEKRIKTVQAPEQEQTVVVDCGLVVPKLLHSCVLCGEEVGVLVKGGWVVKRHYIMEHYRTALLGIVGSRFQAGEKLRCPYPACGLEEKPLSLLGLGWHLDMVHDHLRHVMEEDGREGVRGVVRLLYPGSKEESDQEEEEQRQRKEEEERKQKDERMQKEEEERKEREERRKHEEEERNEREEKERRKREEERKAEDSERKMKEVKLQEEKLKRNLRTPARVKAEPRLELEEEEENEDVDDPSWEPSSPDRPFSTPAPARKTACLPPPTRGAPALPRTAPAPPRLAPVPPKATARMLPKAVSTPLQEASGFTSIVSTPSPCLLCTDKQGKELRLSRTNSEVTEHYKICLYNAGLLFSLVPPGPPNTAPDGSAMDVFGARFQYRCPVADCDRSTRKAKATSYKEYVFHCFQQHGVMRRALEAAREQAAGTEAEGKFTLLISQVNINFIIVNIFANIIEIVEINMDIIIIIIVNVR